MSEERRKWLGAWWEIPAPSNGNIQRCDTLKECMDRWFEGHNIPVLVVDGVKEPFDKSIARVDKWLNRPSLNPLAQTMPEQLSDRDIKRFLSDVITTAVEGGVGYWALCENYKVTDDPTDPLYTINASVRIGATSNGVSVLDTWTLVDHGSIQNAIDKIKMPGVDVGIRSDRRLKIIKVCDALDGAELDAEMADSIMQVAVLGKLTYG